ncbi:esterase-like activity of phytase family protein [Synechococcus sp. UW140]|uniref:choice-of-anchor I domain-containing protein n=1 Tax=Synechococcus sp. UW140 TaxID=368503 RepID=UPI003137E818
MTISFLPLSTPTLAVDGLLNLKSLGANAEITAYNPKSGYAYTVGGGSGAIIVIDLRNPTAPSAVGKGTPSITGQTLQSAAVFGNLLAVAAQNVIKTSPGTIQFFNVTNPALPVHISTVEVGALPDMVKFNSDGSKLIVTNEGEPNDETGTANDYTIDPNGSISVINTSAYLATTPIAPLQADVKTIDFSAWNNRKAELINRGIRITGKTGVTTTLAQDIEPEAIAIAADGKTAYISLQENNAIAILDISMATPAITSIFSAGIQDWDRGTASAKNYSYTLSYAPGNENLPSGVQAGGLSGLFFAGTETVGSATLDIYYSVTDRGPNGTLVAGKRQFLDPDFQPTIYKLGMDRASGAVTELGKIGLKRADGTPLTGLPQLQGKDDIPVDSTNQNLAYDPFGIDSETISVFSISTDGLSERKVFAVGDEYRGQISIFDFNTGNLIKRYIPLGQKAQLQAQHGSVIGAETIDSLPAIYGDRWSNRGIEGMAYNSIDGLLYAFVQSPLDVDSNNDGKVAERSKSELTRILAINPATGLAVKEFFYLLSGRTGQDKIGDVAFDATKNVFLVMERDSSRLLNGFKHVYEVDLRGATNTLAITNAADQATDGWLKKINVASPELLDNSLTLVSGVYKESSADTLAKAGIKLANKVELFNLPSVGGSLGFDKPEGITIRNDGAVVINYDNDFGVEGANGNAFTVVSFGDPALDTEDTANGGYTPAKNHDVYGLVMPDGLATMSYKGQTYILAAGEGDDRNDFLDPDETATVTALLTTATTANATTAQKAGLTETNSTKLAILKNTGDYDADGFIDQAYAPGSRSLRIFDSKGNVVFDSGSALEDIANTQAVYPVNDREDAKGVEPEMVEVVTLNGRTYAFVALERTTTSMAAIFDVTDPYKVVAVDPIKFPKAKRVEGINIITANNKNYILASSEDTDAVSIAETTFPTAFKLQLLHLADGEAGLLASQTAPYLAALVDAFDGTYSDTLILAGGDNFIPGPFANGGTDLSVRDELNAVTGSTLSMAATSNHPTFAVDIAIHNVLGVEASTIGNHEFDLGSRVFKDSFTAGSGWVGAQFPYLSANLDFSGDADLKTSFVDTVASAGLEEAKNQKGKIVPSAIVIKNGEKIGLVGATTQVIEQISSTGGVEVKGFVGDGSEKDNMVLLASQLQPVIDDLINQGVNKVILMAHLQQIGNEKTLAPLLKGVDIILAAGSNTRLGDSNDVAVAFPGHAADFADKYPIVTKGVDNVTTLIVNTDNEYTYLGRLVVDFDSNGVINPASINPSISGAYAATAANAARAWGVTEAELATTAFAEGTKAENVQDLTDAVQAVISSKDGQLWGYSNVYLEGERNIVRNQETNLGNLSADANLAYAKSIDPTVVLSLKNGGGIRSQIGSIDVVSGLKTPTTSNPAANKPAGAISTLDIENSLRFNNALSLVTVTATKLKELLEHGVAATPNQGRFPQVSGVSFSYDLTKPAGSRIVSATIEDSEGGDLDVVVLGGNLVGDPNRSFRMVTLNFLAGGGDSYPFAKDNVGENRIDLLKTGAPKSGSATFADNGSEQDALAEFLKINYPTLQNAFSKSETTDILDTRIQNLAVRGDEVIDVQIGTAGDDNAIPGQTTIAGFDGKLDQLFTGAGNDTVDTAIASGYENKIFTGSGVDTIFASSRDIITGGSGNDELYAYNGDNNRLSGGTGNDNFHLGSSGNRALGGDGNDVFNVGGEAGTNYLNGGAGVDQFWLVSGSKDLPAAKQFVMDFTPGEDKVGLRGYSFADLSFTQAGSDTLLTIASTAVGHFSNTSASALNNTNNFAF